jgi:hypothetical protein
MDEVCVIHPDGHTSADLIPGAREASTLTHREAGAIGGNPYGSDIPPVQPEWEDAATYREHELEGGGAERERREVIPPDRGGRRNE